MCKVRSEEDSTVCFSALQVIVLVHFSCLVSTLFYKCSYFWIIK